MTLEQLITDPSFHALSACIFGLTSAFKKLLSMKFPDGRGSPKVKLLLGLVPLALGVGIGSFFFPETSSPDSLMAGGLAALPAMVGYDVLKRCSSLPGLPQSLHVILSTLLQSSVSHSPATDSGDSTEDSV